jgi:hypothetical protein
MGVRCEVGIIDYLVCGEDGGGRGNGTQGRERGGRKGEGGTKERRKEKKINK